MKRPSILFVLGALFGAMLALADRARHCWSRTSTRRPPTRFRRAVLLLALACASACRSVPTGATLEPTQPAAVSVPRGAWLAAVVVTDVEAKNEIDLERSLTLAIADYVAGSSYFSRVNLLPGNLREGEVVLHFEFDRYRVRRELHPVNVLTLGLYRLFGGSVHRDVVMISGRLRIEDADGNELALASERAVNAHEVSAYSPDDPFPSSMKERTAVVRALLDEAVAELARGTAAHPTSGSASP